MRTVVSIVAVSLALACLATTARADAMVTGSRPPEKGCEWKRIQSDTSKFTLLAQECVFGDRKITHSIKDYTLWQKFSDSPSPDKVIEVFGKEVGDSPAAALKKKFIAKLDPYEREHCVVKQAKPDEVLELPFTDSSKSAWVIEPDSEYVEKVKASTPPDEIPENVCGEYGLPFDSRAYFEFHATNKSSFAWVIIGQDTPLFDEQSLDF